MSRSKHRTRLGAPQSQRQVSASVRGEREAIIDAHDARDESEEILADLPGGTIGERLESARRGLFLGQPEPEVEEASRPPRRHQFECGCGYIARIALMDAHQQKYRYSGIHAERRPFIQRTPTDQ